MTLITRYLSAEERMNITREMRDKALRVAATSMTIVLEAVRGETIPLEVTQFYARMNVAEMIADLCNEILLLRQSLQHIAETCVEDPDAAQFASRVLDGTAMPPSENPR